MPVTDFGYGPPLEAYDPNNLPKPAPRPQPELKPYTPSWSERLGGFAQDMLERWGASRGYAQGFGQRTQDVAGFVPGVGQALSGNEAYRQFSSGHPVLGALAAAGAIPFPGAGAARGVEGDVARTLLRHNDPAFSEGRIATAIPTTVALKDAAHESNDATIGLERMQSDPAYYGKTAQTIKNMRDIYVDPEASADEAHQALIDHAKSNILALYDAVPDEIRQGSMQWYDGANSLARQRALQYGRPLENVAGAYAAMSPKMDWYQNVSLSDRIMDILHHQGDTMFSPEMGDWADAYSTRAPKPDETAAIYDRIKGKTLGEVDDAYDQAHWVRAYDEAHNAKDYNIVNPDGTFGDTMTTKTGANARVGWGNGMKPIANAISAFNAEDMPTISEAMGGQHKVRSFYNNIVAPLSDAGDVTVDTHAIAAANLRPFSGDDPEVKIGLGNSGPASGGAGAKGLYGAYAEAYRQAAAERDIQPRQMQSVTWEALRGLWSPAQKASDATNAAVDSAWSAFGRGDISRPDAQKMLIGEPSRIDPPTWWTGEAPEQ